MTLGLVLRRVDRRVEGYPAGPGSARRLLSRLVKSSRQGQRAGMRRVRRPERLTATAGTAMIRTRSVRVLTGSCSPRIRAYRLRLWAMTAQANQAALAG